MICMHDCRWLANCRVNGGREKFHRIPMSGKREPIPIIV
jgi:hypothetical protein